MEQFGKKNIEDIFALTSLQDGMLFHHLKNPRSDSYSEQLSLRISGEIDPGIFERAWKTVIKNNEMLRAVFRWEKLEHPVQVILKEHKLQFDYYDLIKHDEIQTRTHLEKIKTNDREKKFDLQKVPFRVALCKIKKDKYELIVSNHHILYDGWSNGIILKEFFTAYDRLSKGASAVPTLKGKFKDFVRWNRGRDIKKEAEFWQNYLEGFDTQPGVPVKKREPGKETTAFKSYSLQFDEETDTRLKEFVKERKLTRASFLYGAWGVLQQRYANTDDIVFGTTVSGRSAKVDGIEDIVGLFINTLPLRSRAIPGEQAIDMLHRMDNTLGQREPYEQTPLVDIKACSEIGNDGELFDSILIIENYPLDMRLISGKNKMPLTVDSYTMVETTHYNLTVTITPHPHLKVVFNYNNGVLDDEAVKMLSGHFYRIVNGLMNHSEQEIASIDILSAEERERILYEFNDTDAEYPADKTIHRLFEEQAERTGNSIALVAAVHGETGASRPHLTYRELNEKATRLAACLRGKGVKPGVFVGVMMERSIEMMVGITAVLKAGGAYLPIDPGFPADRKKYILEDSVTTLLLTRGAIGDGFENPCESLNLEDPALYRRGSEGTGAPEAAVDSAYITYTSGSTGKPKGVVVEHRSVVNILTALQKEYPFLEQDVYLLKTPVVFDVSVAELFGWFLGGGRLTVLENGGEKDPKKIVDTVERTGVTHINFVPSMFAVFVETLDPPNIRRLTTLKHIFLAGEALPAELVKKFRRLQTGIPLENIYGPTEGTVYSSSYALSRWKGKNRIPIGKPLPNIKLYILDRDGSLQPVGVPGELNIGGAGLARGYLNKPELTAQRFYRSYKTYRSYSPYTLYRTGDLARWLPGGNIEYLGRLDHQVKIRGFRVELGEIESRLSEHDGVKEAVVVVGDDASGDKYLCAYFVPHSPGSCESTGLRAYLQEKLPGYMIPLHFVPLPEIPLTPGGKTDRKALPVPEAGPGIGYIAPRHEVDEKLVEIWARVLAVEKNIIGIDRNFFELGGHSLKATSLVSGIHKELDVRVPLETIFKRPTIRALSEYITGAEKKNYIAVEPVEKKDYYALSPAQKRLYVLHRMEEKSTVYNMWGVVGLEDFFDGEKLEVTIGQLIARHESLRTSFVSIGEEVVQRVHETTDFAIEYHDAADHIETILRDFIRPFDLSAAPLLRVGLIKTGEGRYVLAVDMHHIISDGISIEIFIKEFAALFTGKEPPAPKLHYKDFSGWQTGDEGSVLITDREKYWLTQFEEEIPILDLPTDFARPPVRCFEGNTTGFEIGPGETGALNALALEEGATLYMVLLCVFNILLSKLSGREDIVIGTPAAGRGHADLENIIGMFVNTLALRNYPSGQKTFGGFLEEVKEHTLKAFENQDYPFENLVEKAGVNGDKSRNPLFDVVFSLQNPDIPHMELPGLTLKPYKHGNVNRVSKFDLTLRAVEVEDRLALSFEYGTKLFRETSIERFIAYFKRVVYHVLEDRDMRLSVIDVLSEEEKRRILSRFSHTVYKTGYPEDKTIDQLFREQAERTPDHTAVVYGGRHVLTFRELDEKSDGPARLLREKGVEPGSISAIMVRRSVETIVGILGILKAGGAYLPIDPDYPGERIRFMLADSKAGVLFSDTNEFGGPGGTCETIDSTGWEQMSGIPDYRVPSQAYKVPSQRVAYVIYTSGTTGRPKGALIEHRNVVRLLYNRNFPFDFGSNDVWTLFHSYCFDFSVWEMYGALLYGGKLIVISKMDARDPRRFLDIVKEEAATVLNQTPAAFYNLADRELKSPGKMLKLRYVIFGGDALKPAKLKSWMEKYPETRLVNMFGITETTVHVTHKELEERDIRLNISNIGRPIPTLSTYILDKGLRLAPIGVAGELCVGGEGVCRGYLNRPELTAKKFVENPYLSGGRLYRSGDLAKLTDDGQMEYLGRIDHQVKIRGYRIELGEIESRLLRHPEVKEAVVLEQRDGDGDRQLCAYIVPRPLSPAPTGPQLREYLSRFLPDYMVPSYFVEIENIPLTSNGKIDRKVLPVPEVKSGARYTAPRDDIEMKLVEIWSGVLDTRNPIGIDDDFFELGGHSLKAALLISKIHKEFSVKIPLPEIFGAPNIRALANHIKTAVKDKYVSITPVEEKEYYMLSSAQKRLYILQHADLENTAKNIPWIVFLDGPLEREKLEAAFNKLVTRHESLRTSFQTVNDVPVQRVHKGIRLKIDYYDPAAVTDREKEKEIVNGFVTPFDLSRAPLLRVGLIKRDEERHILLTDMHHIISDGTSLMILLDDFLRLYRGEELPSLGIQYKDFSCWQNRLFESGHILEQENYWSGIYPDTRVIPELNLPIDYQRPPQLSYEADYFEFKPGAKETAALYELCLETGTTLYMNLLAFFNILLYKYTGQTDIIAGTGVMGRRHIDLRNIIGMFVNMLAVRNFPRGEKTYIAFLEEVKDTSLKAFENQDVQFEMLVDKLKLKRDLSRNPLFDVAFTVNNFERSTPVTGAADAGGITFTPYEHGFITCVYDLVLDAAEVDGTISLNLKYKTKLFKRATVEKMVERYLDILKQVVENRNIKLGDIAVEYNLINAKSDILQGELDGFEF